MVGKLVRTMLSLVNVSGYNSCTSVNKPPSRQEATVIVIAVGGCWQVLCPLISLLIV